jgi:hypothetical protein
MNWVKQAVENYISPPPLSPSDVALGKHGAPGKPRAPNFAGQLERARVRSRTGFWICVVMLLVLFAAALVVSLVYFDQLVLLGAGGMTAASGVFGASAASCVTLMMRWSRETGRADLLLVLLHDLRARKPDEFDHIVSKLAHEWYGLTPDAAKPAGKPTTTGK